MNLISGLLYTKSNQLQFSTGSIILTIKKNIDNKKFEDLEVNLGIRPENLTALPYKNGDGLMKGIVDLIETMGRETFVYVKSNNQRFTAMTKSGVDLHVGDEIDLYLDQNNLCGFDIETGIEILINNS